MWLRGYSMFPKFFVLFSALELYKGCEAITNAELNSQIRAYSVVEDNFTLADVETLHKQGLGLGRYADFAPVQNPVKFKDVPDSVISGSSHGRGLLHHEPTGYGFDYEEPHYGQGYDHQLHDVHHEPHDYHHYDFHDPGHHHSAGHHHGYGNHHKYYDHGLATKALLWPIAGIALLGAAAALVSNPVLLQLGVVSGKRKRRHIEDIDKTAKSSIKKWSEITNNLNKKHEQDQINIINRMPYKDDSKVVKRVILIRKGKVNQYESAGNDPIKYSAENRLLVPIPLKFKN